MHFYKTKKEGYVVCSVCAERTSFPPSSALVELGSRDHLEYIGVYGVSEGIFRCTECNERFVVIDGRAFREVS